jgi:DNA-binding response OmpR family regulator
MAKNSWSISKGVASIVSREPHHARLDSTCAQYTPQKEVLQKTSAEKFLRRIPVVALTTSQDEVGVIHSYDLGVSSFITKPVTFAEWIEVTKALDKCWIEIIATPQSVENE